MTLVNCARELFKSALNNNWNNALHQQEKNQKFGIIDRFQVSISSILEYST
jgi:hypothetical protein